jgi:hypothetical protein
MRLQPSFLTSQILKTVVLAIACLTLVGFTGCAEPKDEKPNTGILNKTTQEVGEYDPESGDQIADLQVKTSANPLAALGALAPAMAKISAMAIEKHLQLFEAVEERFPRDHEEFMTEIIKKNNVQLPVLPGKRRYQYDVKNHKLVVVEAKTDDSGKK